MMFGKKKKKDENSQNIEMPVEYNKQKRKIRILVTDEDMTGSDLTKMSDFFSLAFDEMFNKLTLSKSLIDVESIPLDDLGVVNETIQIFGMFRTPEFELFPDFSSLPKDIQKKYKAGELILGDSKQVKGNIRAVLIDAKTKKRVKDVTLKKVERVDMTADISRNMLNQMQLKQISQKLDYMISEQSYSIDFMRNQALIRPFLDARDNIMKAQNKTEIKEQNTYLEKAAESLQSAINAVCVDMNTIEGKLAGEVNKKWYKRINRKGIDTNISRLTMDTMILTKYVGIQMQVYYYLEDSFSSMRVLEAYGRNINRFFEKGVVASDKSLALFIHENVEYTDDNRNCWYNMEEQMKPLLDSFYDEIEAKSIYVITGGEDDG